MGTPIRAAAITLVLYASFTAAMLARRHFDPSAFIVAGDEFTNPAAAPAHVHVAPHSSGYDGQFYFRLAIAPFSVRQSVAGVHFDYPVYREQRILYPLLAWLASAGRPAAVPWALIVMNLLAAAAIAGSAAFILQDSPRPLMLAVAIALYPGFLLTMSRDLTEMVEIAFVLAGIALVLARREGLAVVMLAAAVLAKETALIMPVAIAIDRALRKRLRARDALFLVPVATFIGWKMYLFHAWHLPPSLGTDGHFSLPFAGLWQCIRVLAAAPRGQTLLIVEVLLVVTFTIAVAASIRKSSAPSFLKIACVLYALLFFTLGAEFWAEDWAFLRAATDYGVLGAIVALQSPARALPLAIFACGWVGLAAHCIMLR
jgi:hypothetical protein